MPNFSGSLAALFFSLSLCPLLAAQSGRPSKTVAALIVDLKNPNAGVRSQAAQTLGYKGAVAKEAVPALVAALKDIDEEVRSNVAEALGHIGPSATQAIPGLLAALKGDDSFIVRTYAATSLGEIGPASKDAIPAMIAAMRDEDARVRRAAPEALALIAPPSAYAVPALIAVLDDDEIEDSVRYNAVDSLAAIGPDAIPGLLKAMKNGKGLKVRGNAALALGIMGEKGPVTPDVVPALLAAAKDEASNEHDRFLSQSVETALRSIRFADKQRAARK